MKQCENHERVHSDSHPLSSPPLLYRPVPCCWRRLAPRALPSQHRQECSCAHSEQRAPPIPPDGEFTPPHLTSPHTHMAASRTVPVLHHLRPLSLPPHQDAPYPAATSKQRRRQASPYLSACSHHHWLQLSPSHPPPMPRCSTAEPSGRGGWGYQLGLR